MKKFSFFFIAMILLLVQSASPIYAGEDFTLTEEVERDQAYDSMAEEIQKLVNKYRLFKEQSQRLRQESLRLHNQLSEKPAEKIPVLMYHHILEEKDIEKHKWSGNASVISTEAFQEQMAYLYENGYYTATPAELQEFLDGKLDLPEKTVVITFDDGYYSNAVYGYPILQKYNFRATIFTIGHSFKKPRQEFDPKGLQHISIVDSYKYRDVYDFESHTYNLHRQNDKNQPLLIAEDKETILEDLQLSKELINARYFAYPYGRHNENVRQYLKDTGYEMAFTTSSGYVAKGMDRYQLPRFGISPKVKMKEFIRIVEGKAR